MSNLLVSEHVHVHYSAGWIGLLDMLPRMLALLVKL